MSSLPHWARKPNHKKKVVATNRGWMVQETGEYLKLVKNLDQRLKELKKEADSSARTITQKSFLSDSKTEADTSHSEDVKTSENEDLTASDVDTKPKQATDSKKRRGRPPRKSTKNQ